MYGLLLHMVAATIISLGTASTRDPDSCRVGWVPAPVLPRMYRVTFGSIFPTGTFTARGGDVGAGGTSLAGPRVRVRVSEKRTQFISAGGSGWGNLSAAALLLQQRQTLRVLWHNPVRTRLPDPQSSALTSGQQRSATTASHLCAGRFNPVTKDCAKVRAVPIPLRGPSPGSTTSAPKQHGVSRERRG